MTLDEAVALVERKTGDHPISAFEYKGNFYVLMTPLSDYNPDVDVAQCYYPVINGTVQDPINDFGLFLTADDPDAMADAAEHSKLYLEGVQNG